MTSGSKVLEGSSARVGEAPRKGFVHRVERVVERVVERMMRGFLLLWLLAAALVVVSFVRPPHDDLRAADWQLDAGPVESYAIEVPRMVRNGSEPVWVVRLDDKSFVALAAVCRYQHCVLRWNPAHQVFSCPCHRGTYDLDGRVTSGPARQPLRRFFVNLKAERVRVHLLRPAVSPEGES